MPRKREGPTLSRADHPILQGLAARLKVGPSRFRLVFSSVRLRFNALSGERKHFPSEIQLLLRGSHHYVRAMCPQPRML